MRGAYINRATFAFLRELAANNRREWFNANKQRYIDEVRDPLLELVAALGPRLAKISPHIVADPRPVGGSLFRIYRDTRFSHDKSPYKTAAGMSFRHGGKRSDVHGPGYYLHIEPGMVFMGAGMWHPDPVALKQVRDAIVAKPKEWAAARRAGLDAEHGGEALKRPPRGYDPNHPFVDDLKRRSLTASANFTEAQACAADFPSRFVAACRAKAPLMKFLAKAVGVPW
jgi:uncharacterized protein (TIGR02453 family)